MAAARRACIAGQNTGGTIRGFRWVLTLPPLAWRVLRLDIAAAFDAEMIAHAGGLFCSQQGHLLAEVASEPVGQTQQA